MQPLRQARFLARLVLAWFVFALGAAIASPLVKPQAMELVCSGSGAMKLLVKGDDGSLAQVKHTLDCPLCTTAGAPPPVVCAEIPAAQPLGRAVQAIPAAHIAALTAAPIPARGPPASLS
ncbi:DUF2946 domain-containing protein [Ramlibacter albus]|uniref:DUF2946 domain-containing protein n=1 Tax=Ramlibacter albus TaxID=2079448 RepID=A0A923M6D3_9BURK|nr:DUF2946 domain-containing protein [Ramlibacter albus]MBC5763544.1 DUF2946 domain-containing protein [Ramlibacter albus]